MSIYKVLFLDIDGTTVRPDDTIEESTRTAVAKVQDQGIDVFLATGRPIHEIKGIAKELNVSSFIGYNGAYGIYKGDVLYQDRMNPGMVENFLEIATEHGHEMVMYTNSHNAFTTLEKPSVEKFIKKFHLIQNKLYSIDDLNNVLGITLINVKENVDHCYANEEVHLTQVNVEGMRNCYDVIRDKVNKGFGVHSVLAHLGISKESAIAFGDGLNDKEMLMNVGEGFAMGNAHPDLFEFAKHRTTSVTDSGIYNGLQALGLLD